MDALYQPTVDYLSNHPEVNKDEYYASLAVKFSRQSYLDSLANDTSMIADVLHLPTYRSVATRSGQILNLANTLTHSPSYEIVQAPLPNGIEPDFSPLLSPEVIGLPIFDDEPQPPSVVGGCRENCQAAYRSCMNGAVTAYLVTLAFIGAGEIASGGTATPAVVVAIGGAAYRFANRGKVCQSNLNACLNTCQ